ncbi:MAG: Lrp/AsnC ligand binding domain-containing protein [Thaumarchaeota archaeon]|nr:Lrp/AsnC ligand binding domain-containing protein [Nitrososphaerota archaeon]
MVTAYVLINCNMGSEESVIQELKSIIGVRDVQGVFGAYDIITKVESKTVEELRDIITWKIRKLDNIRSTLTMMEVKGQS